jgi:hypothetical protein
VQKLVVLLHEAETVLIPQKYLISLLMQAWEHMGIIVEVIRGIDRFVPADAIIPHVDLTIRPSEYREFLSQYPLVINQLVVDISKSKISANILEKQDMYTGPVIVKTDRNCGGLAERHLLTKQRTNHSVILKFRHKIASRLRQKYEHYTPWRYVKHLQPSTYPVLSSLSQVPKGIFANKNLIIEKFLPEIKGNMYCLRYYYFFGDQEMNFLARSQVPVVKGANIVVYEEAPIPSELRAIRQRLGIDYGRFDYVLRAGKVVLFDTNWTPTYDWFEVTQRVGPHLARGIQSMLGRKQQRYEKSHNQYTLSVLSLARN